MGVVFLDRLEARGARSALVFADGTQLSYAELADRMRQRQQELDSERKSARKLIFWSADPTADAIVTYLAALQAGHPIVPLPPCDTASGDRWQDLAARYRPDVMARGSTIERHGIDPHDIESHRIQSLGDASATKDLHPDLALLLSTSGSTGAAKLARLSAGNIAANATSIAAYMELQPQDRSALILPLHYSYGLSVLHAHLSVGASLYFPSGSILMPHFIDEVARARCTNLSGVPHSFELLEQIGFRHASLPDMRFMTVAGGRLAPDRVRIYARHMATTGGAFFVMYGQTEATARMAYLPPQDAIAYADCIGEAIPGGQFYLANEDGTEIKQAGLTGELIYRGANVMMGYAESRADLARGLELGSLATGDYAERDPSGYFRLVGRRQRFSKIAGLRIAHDAVEIDLQRAGIDALVSGDDRHLFIAVTAEAHVTPAWERVRRLTRLPSSCLKIQAIVDPPRGSAGKIDYRALVACFAADVAPSTDTPHAAITAVFANIFAPRRVSGSDSFSSLGGDSLSFIELSLTLKPVLDPLPRAWEHLSINDLARAAADAIPVRPRRFVLPLAEIDTDLALRAGAILLILLHHATLWPIAGGAAILLTLVGYNLARHHARRLFTGDIAGMLRSCLRPIVIYYPLLIALSLISGNMAWQSLLLVGNLGIDGYSTQGSPLITFWFVETYAQILTVTALLFALPILRRIVARRPFAAGLVGLGAALVSRWLTDFVLDLGEMRYFFTPRIIYVVLIGWCLYFADTHRRKLAMSVILVVAIVGLMVVEGTTDITIVWVRAASLLFSACMLLWSTRLYLPAVLVRPLTAIAIASFSIYLFHTLPYFAWLSAYEWSVPWRAPAYVGLGLAAGLVAHVLLQRLESTSRQMAAILLSRLQRLRSRSTF